MRRRWLIGTALAVLLGAVTLFAQATKVQSSGTLPTSCVVGNVYVKTGASAGWYVCLATNTWTGPYSTTTGTGDASTNTSSSVDGEMALFSGTGGKTLKRSTLTGGLVKSTSGVPAIASAGTDYVIPAGNVATATALAANGSNCSSGQFPLGVDASGASENCTALPTTISGTSNEVAASASTGAVTLSLPTTVNLTSHTFRVPNSTSLPGTCTVGDSYMDTDATSGSRWYLCETTNTWVVQGGGGGGSVTTTGSPASGNLAKFSGASSITNTDLTGDVTTSGTAATTIANSAVTLAKIANASASSKLVGSGASGSGSAYAEITLGTNLSMSGTTLNAAGASSGLVLVEQHAASSSASLAFTSTITGTYDTYLCRLVNLIPATNTDDLLMDVSTDGGSTWSSSAVYYYTYLYTILGGLSNGSVVGGAVTAFKIAGANSSTAAAGGVSGELQLMNPGNSSASKEILFKVIQHNSGDSSYYKYDGGGVYASNTAVNAVRIRFSSGNIASGTMRCYGLSQ